MTNPLASAGSGSPSIVNVRPDDTGLTLLMQALQASRARKQRQAEIALGLVNPGETFGQLSPDAQKSVELATGRKYQPGEVVSPISLTQDEAATDRLIKGLGLDPNSTLAMGLKGRLAARIATGQSGPLATPAQLQVEQEAASSGTRAQLSKSKASEIEQGARVSEAKSFASAVGRVKSGEELSPDEVAAYQHFNQFTPSQAIGDQLGGQARAEVMKQALRLAADPDSASFAKILLPLGVTPSDAIGAVALGIGGAVQTAMGLQASLMAVSGGSRSAATDVATRSLFEASTDISKRMGGAYSPTFIAGVMEGDPKLLATPAGQMVQRFTSAGFTTALTDLATKGDPSSISFKQLLDVARVPQISSNPELLGKYSNLLQGALASSLTRTFTGMDRPEEAGDAQKAWDAANAAMLKKTAGVFTYNWLKGRFGSGLTITPQGQTSDATGVKPKGATKNSQDSRIVEETLRALFNTQAVPSDTLKGGR